jgi:hypothetical protein
MTSLPPPTPIAEPPTTPPTGSRRRLVLAAVAATALGVGGLVAGSTLASADDEPADETIDDDERVGDGTWDMPSLDELDTAFEDFEACLSEQLPDLVGGGWHDVDGGELPDIGQLGEAFDELLGGTVTVFTPGAEDGDLTLLDFGEGDGTITITQTDGEITLSIDGDVENLETSLPDLGDLDLGDLDLGDFDLGDFDLGDLDLGDLDLGDIDLGDIDLGDIDLGDIDLGDIDLGDTGFEPDPELAAAFEECTTLLPGGGLFDMIGEFVDDFGDAPRDQNADRDNDED